MQTKRIVPPLEPESRYAYNITQPQIDLHSVYDKVSRRVYYFTRQEVAQRIPVDKSPQPRERAFEHLLLWLEGGQPDKEKEEKMMPMLEGQIVRYEVVQFRPQGEQHAEVCRWAARRAIGITIPVPHNTRVFDHELTLDQRIHAVRREEQVLRDRLRSKVQRQTREWPICPLNNQPVRLVAMTTAKGSIESPELYLEAYFLCQPCHER